MKFWSHVIGGATIGAVIASRLPLSPESTAAAIGFAVIAAAVPDRVQYQIPGRHLPLEGHRGLSHTLLFAVATSLFWLVMLHPIFTVFWFGGLLSHYLLDLPSDVGIPLWWPIVKHRVRLGWFNNGTPGELIARGLMLAWLSYTLLSWIKI